MNFFFFLLNSFFPFYDYFKPFLSINLYFWANYMKTLLLGAYGQVGQELMMALSKRIGMQNIVCADIKEPPSHLNVQIHEKVDATN